MRNLLLTAAAAIMAFSASAETATFSFTGENPYDWSALPQDESGYINDEAKPLTLTETPVSLSLDGRFRRAVQNAFGGISCLLLYQNSTADFSVGEGYRIQSVAFYTGDGKCEQLACVSEGTGLSPQELTDVKYTHTNGSTELQEAVRTAMCGAPSASVGFKVTAKGTQVITRIEVEYIAEKSSDYNFYNFTAFEADAVSAFPSIKVGTWWTTNPDDAESYMGGTEFRPLTISLDRTQITFSYDGEGGHGNIQGAVTTKQNNLQLGGGACFTVSPVNSEYRLIRVTVQGNRKRTASGLSKVCMLVTDDKGTVDSDEATQVLTWTPKEAGAACFLDAKSNGAYIESITADYEAVPISTGIAVIEAEAEGVAEYFDLRGVRVDNPSAGIYLRRLGEKVEKVVIR